MKKQKILFSGLVILAVLIFSLTPVLIIFIERNRIYYTGELVILKDSDFSKHHFSGDGTEESPFIIENLLIDTTKEYGIRIEDVTKNFIIRNCSFKISLLTFSWDFDFSKLIEISNSNLLNSIICNNSFEIYSHSIYIGSISSIHLEYSSGIIIENNTFSRGIGIQIVSSDDIIISNNSFNGGYIGIELDYCSNTIIQKNLHHSSEIGVQISTTSFCTINDNEIYNCEIGIYVKEKSKNLEIFQNTLQSNSEYGIYLEKMSNYAEPTFVTYIRIYHNYFIDNYNGSSFTQAYDANASFWYNNNLNEGNFWSDYVWIPGTVYNIDGGENFDPYPMEIP
ncbi:MAG: nitrous oxide reductase family maturation protein NosD [Candidatus Thorarchaeota archaeon]